MRVKLFCMFCRRATVWALDHQRVGSELPVSCLYDSLLDSDVLDFLHPFSQRPFSHPVPVFPSEVSYPFPYPVPISPSSFGMLISYILLSGLESYQYSDPNQHTLSYLTLLIQPPHNTLPYLPYPALQCSVLPCPALPYPTLPYHTLPYPTLLTTLP